jgi:hypothetical protein
VKHFWRHARRRSQATPDLPCLTADAPLKRLTLGIVQCPGGKAKDAKRAAAKEKKAEKSGGLASMVSHPPNSKSLRTRVIVTLKRVPGVVVQRQ